MLLYNISRNIMSVPTLIVLHIIIYTYINTYTRYNIYNNNNTIIIVTYQKLLRMHIVNL